MGMKSIWHKKKRKKRKSILRPQEDKSPQAWQLIIHVYFHLQPRPDVSRNQGQAPVKAETIECGSSRNKASRLCQWRQDCRAAADCFTSTEPRHGILIPCWISMIFSAAICPQKKNRQWNKIAISFGYITIANVSRYCEISSKGIHKCWDWVAASDVMVFLTKSKKNLRCLISLWGYNIDIFQQSLILYSCWFMS